jgi:hypothetical protein
MTAGTLLLVGSGAQLYRESATGGFGRGRSAEG